MRTLRHRLWVGFFSHFLSTSFAFLCRRLVCPPQLLPRISASKTSEFSFLSSRLQLKAQIPPAFRPWSKHVLDVPHSGHSLASTRQDSVGDISPPVNDCFGLFPKRPSQEQRWGKRLDDQGPMRKWEPQRGGDATERRVCGRQTEATCYVISRFPPSLARIFPNH